MGVGRSCDPALLKRHNLIDDMGTWSSTRLLAVQVIYCRDKLGIDPNKLNVNGGSIAIATAARLTGHILMKSQAPQGKMRRMTMCIGGGMGAAVLLNRPLIGNVGGIREDSDR